MAPSAAIKAKFALKLTLWLLLQEARELLLEARQAAATIDKVLLAAGPRGMRLRIDVQMQRIAGFAPSGPRGELGTVGHDDFNGVIVGMGIRFHGLKCCYFGQI